MKVLKWVLISLAVIVLLLFIAFKWMQSNAKKLSPEGSVAFKTEQFDVEMNYSRPSVRGRTIFGDLVPYGKVWRTGANEPTTFKTETDLLVNGETLPAGTYTVWTIPGEQEWEFIFNSKEYPWGVGWDGEALREVEYDVLRVPVYKETTPNIIETLSISMVEIPNGFQMQLAWENSLLRIDFKQ